MSMRANAWLTAVATLALVCPGDAWAWGPLGHRTVAAIADSLLAPRARERVEQLLAHDLDKFGNPSGRTTLEEVSVWADEIRGTPAAHDRWHYDDIPVCGTAPKALYCPEGQCNTVQLERLIGVLGDRQAAARDRDEALKWVVHLVGDIHQPLHAADNQDHGGNQVPVVLSGVRTRGRESLHRAWDTELAWLALDTRSRQQPPRDIGALAVEARRLVARTGQGSPGNWAAESNNLAKNVAYRYPGFACDRPPQGTVVLDVGYQRAAEAVVRKRLLLAGGRLANLLNRVLASGP